MAEIVVYHNPNCGTSRGVLEILSAAGVDVDVVQYLKTPLSKAQLETIVDAIDVEPGELVRDDNRFKELGLDQGDYITKAAVVKLLLAHPELMQRPVVIKGKTVILARPKDKIHALI
jgi:arsenate reductase (glutaredoxin)